MQIGVPKEVVDQEYRVGLTPSSVRELIYQGHRVLVETNAGAGVGLSDKDYKSVGASIAKSPGRVFSDSELIVKVKEPQPNECKMLSLGQTIFTYLHLASDPKQANGLLDSGCAAIAYETVTDKNGGLPLLAPMSEVAGRMSVQIGAHYLEKAQGGSGVLIGGVPGVKAANVVIIGGGIAGTQAVRIALGMRAMVTVIDKNPDRLRELDEMFGDSLNTIQSTTDSIEHYVIDADLVIGAVLVTGSTAPKLVSRKMIRMMRPGSVVLDIAIDQGGCFETSRATTHTDPVYLVDGVIHYCVANMPGSVARTSTFALNNATLPFAVVLANKGTQKACSDNPHLRSGLNIYSGQVTHRAVAMALRLKYQDPQQALGI
ncbi:MAG: alanine dehydrogenase [Nitrosomonadaceae bacterium]|nr:alanine dehydrogenase [Nitrosospira sp.]MDW7597655.1 alanine dehydrogenase [Nitrosomonadaceae bacterium]MBI0409146.1 alanine dehydrogenase [Nitrosospira sp.]MBI0413162.1 alanine dehydrogenase [Nitrosospira sp.]MBI0420960.1 alanine dehydrogenase [Nitrosospira sp.]